MSQRDRCQSLTFGNLSPRLHMLPTLLIMRAAESAVPTRQQNVPALEAPAEMLESRVSRVFPFV